MEDLIPFLIFLVIVAANVVKYLAEKGRPAKPAQKPGQTPPRRPASSLEEFFESLAEQVKPQPTELPDWPESRERPDYVGEMAAFERARAEELEEEQTAEIIPMPEPKPTLAKTAGIPAFQPMEKASMVAAPLQTAKSILSGAQGMRMPSINPFQHVAEGHVDFRIKDKKELRRAMLAHVVFSPPRAYDLSCDNTIAKQGRV